MSAWFTNSCEIGGVDFNVLVNTYSLPLYLYAKKTYDSSEAEDVVQDCLLRLWERRNKIGEVINVEGFLYTMVRNECLNRLKRKNLIDYRESIDQNVVFDECYCSDMEEIDLIEMVLAVIETLPNQYAKIMRLTVDGMKNSEIAATLNIAENSVKAMKTRSMKRIKKVFGEEVLTMIIMLVN